MVALKHFGVNMKILVTGGAGFIGSHLVDHLVADGHMVKIIDSLSPQVHPGGKTPAYLNRNAEFIHADVRDRQKLLQALTGCDRVIHLAGAVGVGQSQYQIEKYTSANVNATATLLDIIVNERLPIAKIVVAASMSSYGEGLYHCRKCGNIRPGDRRVEDMAAGRFEPRCLHCEGDLKPISTPETAFQDCRSVYALNKKQQEELVLGVGRTYQIPAVALRFFNVFGSRQSLSNPYNGVAAIFISRLKNNQPPVIFEDGLQSRDFIAVADVVRGINAALHTPRANGFSINLGSGQPRTIVSIAKTLAGLLDKDLSPEVTGTFRVGDIRHCFADLTRARELLDFAPNKDFSKALAQVVSWSEKEVAEDHFTKAQQELSDYRLV